MNFAEVVKLWIKFLNYPSKKIGDVDNTISLERFFTSFLGDHEGMEIKTIEGVKPNFLKRHEPEVLLIAKNIFPGKKSECHFFMQGAGSKNILKPKISTKARYKLIYPLLERKLKKGEDTWCEEGDKA